MTDWCIQKCQSNAVGSAKIFGASGIASESVLGASGSVLGASGSVLGVSGMQ